MNVTLTDDGYTLDGKWRLVPSEYMESLTLPNPPAELAISAKPVAVVDAGDDGYFAEILPDCSVSVGDQLYAFPPLNVSRELWIESFSQWWEAHGQYLRAGGGQYEKTFGYHAWEAAAALYVAPNPLQSLSPFAPDWANYQQGRKDGRADAVAEMRSALSATPVRRMTMSGQMLSYVQLDELNGELDAIYSKTLPEPAP